jgi:hypothetical protein
VRPSGRQTSYQFARPIPQDTGNSGPTVSWSVVLYAIGGVCTGVGIYLCSITRLYLYTGQTTSPDLGVGIPLALVGLVVVIVTQRTARQHMNR